jgi:hypothetical protein
MKNVGIFYGHFGDLAVICYIFPPVLVNCIKENLATLAPARLQNLRETDM